MDSEERERKKERNSLSFHCIVVEVQRVFLHERLFTLKYCLCNSKEGYAEALANSVS